MSNKRVWLYGRVAQDSGEGRELERQMDFLRRWAAENGFTVAGETAEVGSGIRAERPGRGWPKSQGPPRRKRRTWLR